MDESRTHLVATFGISDFDRMILDRIFRISSKRPQTYVLAEEGDEPGADIALLDASTQEALTHWQAVSSEYPSIRTVNVVKEESEDSGSSLCRPFVPKRVFHVLDDVISERSECHSEVTNEGEAPQEDAVSRQGAMTKGACFRELVVDDSQLIRTQVGLALQDADVEVAYAECGEKALEMVNQETFDIIFLDVLMTGLDGYEVCKAIKRDKTRRHIPIVMLTSQSSPFDKIKGKFCGCDAYLSKPVRREEFRKTVDQHLVKALTNE